MLSYSADADDKPLVNGEHPATESSQDADDSHSTAADDSQLAAANDTAPCDVTVDIVTLHIT